MSEEEKTTIAAVAQEAGVSALKVSHVLNKARGVSKQDRANVMQAIKDLDYRPDVVAQALHETRPPQVFVSYARTNWEQFVKPLVARLEQEELLVWVDQFAIRGGEDWLDEIALGLKRCSVLVLCVTPEALNSRFVKKEYRYFLVEDKPLIPVICAETQLPFELLDIQYVPYAELDELVEQIKDLLE